MNESAFVVQKITDILNIFSALGLCPCRNYFLPAMITLIFVSEVDPVEALNKMEV